MAALNPYRRKKKTQEETFGLVFKHNKKANSDFGTDDMSSLVYRVTPVPASLRDFIFDFGALSSEQAREYINQMVKSILRLYPLQGFFFLFSFFAFVPCSPPLLDPHDRDQIKIRRAEYSFIVELLITSQDYCRKVENDPSCVSLRDVRRAIGFMNFFLDLKNLKGSRYYFILYSSS